MNILSITAWILSCSFVTCIDIIEGNQLHRSLVSLYHLFSSQIADQNNDEFSSFSILDSEAIHSKLKSLSNLYPNYATLQNAQDLYNLPAAGNETDCLFEKIASNNNTVDKEKGCKNWIFTIQDDTETSNKLPEIFLSAGMHGDEKIGPTALVELASILLEVAQCESLPNSEQTSSLDSDDQLSEAMYCRRSLASRGITNYYRKWIARLVATRRIVIVPIVNSLGFFRGDHDEDGTDPSTDFSFDQNDSKRCMETISARVINEIFRNHVFYIAVNFHSGKPLIAYNWASPSYLNKNAPDNRAQNQIAIGLASFAGINNWESQHLIGPMNKLVIKTKGTMQDWAYAGSWESNMAQCNPTTYNGYPREKTVYSDSHLRALSMLVDFSEFKNPSNNSHLGSRYDICHPHSLEDGYIPRLLRASLMMIDIVEPYVIIRSIHGTSIQDDIVPSALDHEPSKTVSIPHGTAKFDISWEVGGAFSVDTTNLIYAKFNKDKDMPLEKLLQSLYKSVDGDEGFFSSSNNMFYETQGKSGNTRWSQNPPDAKTMFQATINATSFNEGDLIAVFATAQVDNAWEDQPNNVSPDLPPQTHLVNARLNPKWHHENAGRVVKGNVQWFSMPVTIIIGPPHSKTKELNLRIPLPIKMHDARRKLENIMFVAIVSALLFSFVGIVVYRKRRPSLQKERNKRNAMISDEIDENDDEYLEKMYKNILSALT